MSALELERGLRREGRIVRPSDGKEPQRVAFIQCVGSRDRERPYCSQVCCGYALRLAEVLRVRQGAEATIFYIDIQSFGQEFVRNLSPRRERVRLVRMMPGDVTESAHEGLILSYMDSRSHEVRDEEFDLVVLSVGLAPSPTNETLARLLGLERDAAGFLGPAPERGIFVAGCAAAPMGIADSSADALRAAWEAASHIGGCRG